MVTARSAPLHDPPRELRRLGAAAVLAAATAPISVHAGFRDQQRSPRRAGPLPVTLPELSLVRLTRPLGDFPEGTVGTVVHAYAAGLAYEVEFNLAWDGEPENDWRNRVVTVEREWVEPA